MRHHLKAKHLHVIAPYHNPLRYRSRANLFREFIQRMLSAGVDLTVVEAALHDRHWEMNVPGVHHIPVVQHDELWVKENMINIGISSLPDSAEYIAWIDGDVSFDRLDWAEETIHQLQHYKIVQMFRTAVDLGPEGEATRIFNGFGYSWATGQPEFVVGTDYYGHCGKGQFWHPGFAWAINRDTLDHLGRLIDWSSLGSGDHMMALALIHKVRRAVPKGMHPNFLKHALIWEERAQAHVHGDLGYVPGTLLHHWHGRKVDRRYNDRWKILKKHWYDPERDIKMNAHGVYILTHHGERLRTDLRRYFRSRNEDSIDTE